MAGGERLSILWLVPQFLVFGVSELFTNVGLMEFFNVTTSRISPRMIHQECTECDNLKCDDNVRVLLLLQGYAMDTRLSTRSFHIPPASQQAIPYAILLLLVPA
ncbi:hypothetical protein EJB05_09635, partial [Eragrostis curvula]